MYLKTNNTYLMHIFFKTMTFGNIFIISKHRWQTLLYICIQESISFLQFTAWHRYLQIYPAKLGPPLFWSSWSHFQIYLLSCRAVANQLTIRLSSGSDNFTPGSQLLTLYKRDTPVVFGHGVNVQIMFKTDFSDVGSSNSTVGRPTDQSHMHNNDFSKCIQHVT